MSDDEPVINMHHFVITANGATSLSCVHMSPVVEGGAEQLTLNLTLLQQTMETNLLSRESTMQSVRSCVLCGP